MLKKLRLVNFQCHHELEVELHPLVTVLIGDNSRGKSAVIRAIRWAALNEWSGKADAFIHWHAEDAQVDLEFTEGNITRLKGKQGNFYIVNDQELEAVGVKVPNAAQKITNLTGDNFQEQLDPAFWFSLTSGQVAKSLNKIVNLESIDSSLANIGTEVRASKVKTQEAADRLASARNLKKSLDWTIQADKDLKELEGKTERQAEIVHGLAGLARWRRLLVSLSSKKQHAAGVVLSGQKVIDKMGSLDKIDKQLNSIKEGLGQVRYGQGRVKWIRQQLAEKEPRLKEAEAGKCPLCRK